MKHLMHDPVEIKSVNGYNKNGKEIWGAAQLVYGRFVEQNRLVVGPDGKQTQADASVVIADTDVTIDINSRINFSGTSFEVLTIRKSKNSTGRVHHFTAYLKRIEHGN